MKNSLTKLLVSCAAVMSVAALMAVSAYADDAVTYDKASKTITNGAAAPAGLESGKQITILVQKETDSALTEGDIIYINQDAFTGTVPWATIVTADELANGNYYLKMGGEGVTAITSELFEVSDGESGEKVTAIMGDVDRSGGVAAKDAMLIARYAVGNEAAIAIVDKSVNSHKLADVDGNGTIAAKDAMLVARAAVGNETAMGYTVEVELDAADDEVPYTAE